MELYLRISYLLLLHTVAGVQDDVTYGTAVCRDRYGMLEPERYNLRSCTMCYYYLFPKGKMLYPSFPDMLSLRVTNSSFHAAGGDLSDSFIAPDIHNVTVRQLICVTLNSDQCERWTSCCMAASSCCDRQAGVSSVSDSTRLCPTTWDGYKCWTQTSPGEAVASSCPSFLEHSLTTRQAFKQCTENGTWYQKAGLEWTDYTPCMDKEGYIIGVYISLGCSVISISLLVPAVIIFIHFRDLRHQHRVKLHIHFFISLALSGLVSVLWFLLVHHDLLVNPVSTNTVMYNNPVWCRILSFFKIYLTSTTYFWMFCEGYYLHRLISNAFEPPKTLILLYLLGWGAPAAPALVYSGMLAVKQADSCWAKSYGQFQWIIYAPNLFCLVVNLLFLSNILRILLFQLHAHPHEPSSFRRGLKAAFMLIPLFGLQMFVTIYRPPVGAIGEKEFEYVTFFITNSQGFFVALVYCFFNGEVITHLRKTCCSFCPSLDKRKTYVSRDMTQVTTFDDRRSPTGSDRSAQQCPLSDKMAQGNWDYEMTSLPPKQPNTNGIMCKANSSPPKRSAYTPIPTIVTFET